MTFWVVTIETRLPTDPVILAGSETFAVGAGSVIRTADGNTIVNHDAIWSSHVIRLAENREIRACRLVATGFPMRHYPDAASVYADEVITSIAHGSDCSRSLFCLAQDGGFIDPEFPDCQRLAAAGSLAYMAPSDLAEGRWLR